MWKQFHICKHFQRKVFISTCDKENIVKLRLFVINNNNDGYEMVFGIVDQWKELTSNRNQEIEKGFIENKWINLPFTVTNLRQTSL